MAFGDLTTLAAVKAWLQTGQNAFPDTDDTLLSGLITAASQFIQSWLQRQIASADWQEIRDGTGGNSLVFANYPVTAMLSLTIDGLTIPPAPTGGGFGAGYVFTPTMLGLRGYAFTRSIQNVIMTYTAGHAVIPPEIAQACVELVCQRYRERTRIGEVSKALAAGETITYSQKDMSDDVRTALWAHRAVAPVSGFRQMLTPPSGEPLTVNVSYLGVPQAGTPILSLRVGQAISFAANFGSSVVKATTAATADTVFLVEQNGSFVGTMLLAAGSQVASFTAASSSLAVNDLLTIAPTRTDATLADLSGSLCGSATT